MELLKKLTIARLGLDKDVLLRTCIDAQGPVAVARIFGRANQVESKLGDLGPYCLFKGSFEGTNLLSGVSYRAGHLILNGPAEGILEGQVSLAGEGGEAPFVFEIGVEYAGKDAKGNPYRFTAKMLGESVLNLEDPLKALRAIAMNDAPKVIDGPKETKKGEKAKA
jgi:hypothetical protein